MICRLRRFPQIIKKKWVITDWSPISVLDKHITLIVIPAKAGIHYLENMDSRLRGNDN